MEKKNGIPIYKLADIDSNPEYKGYDLYRMMLDQGVAYVVEDDRGGDIFWDVAPDLDSANNQAVADWHHLTRNEQKNSIIRVLKILPNDLEFILDEDGKLETCYYQSSSPEPGAWDSVILYTTAEIQKMVDKYIKEEYDEDNPLRLIGAPHYNDYTERWEQGAQDDDYLSSFWVDRFRGVHDSVVVLSSVYLI